MNKTHLAAALMAAVLSGSLMAETLVTVNGSKIDSSEIDRQVKFLQSNGQVQADSPQLRDNLIRRTITRTLIAQEARRLKLDELPEFKQASEQARTAAKEQGFDKQPAFKQQWADYQTDLLNQAFLMTVLNNRPVSEAEVKKDYDDMQAFYRGSSEIQMGEIMTPKQEDAQKAIEELKAKKPFAEVAKRYSADPAAQQSGGIDKSYTPLKDLEEMAPPVYNAVKDLKKGQYTPTPLPGEGVYAVFYVHDKRAVQIPAYDLIKANLARRLQDQRIDQAIAELYKKANIVPAK